MLSELIDIRIFLISLAIGLFFIYMMGPDKKKVYIYPSPDNVDKFQYKDNTYNCFAYEANEVTCPTNEDEISKIPYQK
jgi:hypothetical protein